tara:strand:- start:306 stop:491 length:186 start_codon:yes stop_codon:yes gene_type:complete
MENDERCEVVHGIGLIGNYYGGLSVKSEGDKFFWSIEDYSGEDWQEITERLYMELLLFENK